MNETNHEIKILTYNVFLCVPAELRYTGQNQRVHQVKNVIENIEKNHSIDIITFQEIIPVNYEQIIAKDLFELGFIYKTTAKSKLMAFNSGIFIFSKHEIVQEDYVSFGDTCVNSDCYASKGIVYARIKKGLEYHNIFSTHTNAWFGIQDKMVRENQFRIIKDFMISFDIPITESVILSGDLNIDWYLEQKHLDHVLYLLDMDVPELYNGSHPFTADHKTNQLVGLDDINAYKNEEYPDGCSNIYYQTLHCPCCKSYFHDYVFISKKHRTPKHSSMLVVPSKVHPFEARITYNKKYKISDVSDHYPVIGTFTFSPLNANMLSKSTRIVPSKDMESMSNTLHLTNLAVIMLLVVITVIVVIYFIIHLWRTRQKETRLKNIIYNTSKKQKHGSDKPIQPNSGKIPTN
jgi:exonuclease III